MYQHRTLAGDISKWALTSAKVQLGEESNRMQCVRYYAVHSCENRRHHGGYSVMEQNSSASKPKVP